MNILLALVPALFWGIMPLMVSKVGGNPVQQILGTTFGTLIFAGIYSLFVQPTWTPTIFWFSFASGLSWTIGQILQYKSYTMLGVSHAMPISTAMQLVGNALMGVLVFGEWASGTSKLMGFGAILLIIVGSYLTTYKENKTETSANLKAGLLVLLISTLGYVGYSFFPRAASVSSQDALLAQAIGMMATSLVIGVAMPASKPASSKSLLNSFAGLSFGIAALGYLYSAQQNGVAVGFSLSQMNVVIATLGSIFILGEKKTSKEMRFVLLGLLIVVAGGITIGLIPK